MSNLWIFEVSIITFQKMWLGSTKTMIQHDVHQLYISGLLQYGEVRVVEKTPCSIQEE